MVLHGRLLHLHQKARLCFCKRIARLCAVPVAEKVVLPLMTYTLHLGLQKHHRFRWTASGTAGQTDARGYFISTSYQDQGRTIVQVSAQALAILNANSLETLRRQTEHCA